VEQLEIDLLGFGRCVPSVLSTRYVGDTVRCSNEIAYIEVSGVESASTKQGVQPSSFSNIEDNAFCRTFIFVDTFCAQATKLLAVSGVFYQSLDSMFECSYIILRIIVLPTG